jgi:LysR family transcriptional regulator, hydrogen peroxide-inducible genes activator
MGEEMNLRTLKYLIALAEEGHFSRAARVCNVSQPTLSIQLKKLEDYLGVQLIERRAHEAVPTPVGREVIALARVIVSTAEQIRSVSKLTRKPLQR